MVFQFIVKILEEKTEDFHCYSIVRVHVFRGNSKVLSELSRIVFEKPPREKIIPSVASKRGHETKKRVRIVCQI